MSRLFTIIALFAASFVSAQQNYLIGGSGMECIAIIDPSSHTVTWSHQLEPKQECNSLLYCKGGDIAYSYRWGAKLIDRGGEVLFDYNDLKPNEEVQSISQIKGGYLVGICGSPARLIELNNRGEVVKEVVFDTKIKQQHGQFRQICKSKKGTYIIPLLGRKSIVEIDESGEQLAEFELGESPFSVLIKRDGGWLAPCGHSGKIFEIDPKSGEMRVFISNDKLEGVNIEFGAQIVELKNGNFVLSNWLGHNGDTTQPILIEFNRAGEIVGRVENKIEGITMVSAVCPIY